MTELHARHPIKPRPVQFNLEQTPLHWIPDDPFASSMFNGIHQLLPAGEFWFCRVYNKALPYISDPVLRADVEGFIRQEAIHARTHAAAQEFLHRHGLGTAEFLGKVELLFVQMLGDAPLGQKWLQLEALEKRWLILRVGVIAAIEHFTGVLGQWSLDNTSLDKADPVMADLFRWHLAEEVEHRNVAFDLFEHLCRTQLGFYVSRQALMAIVFPIFTYYMMEGARSMARQDRDRKVRALGRQSVFSLLFRMERTGRSTQNLPTTSFLLAAVLRWLSPGFHPESEGDTQQALDYMARSPAVRALQGAAA